MYKKIKKDLKNYFPKVNLVYLMWLIIAVVLVTVSLFVMSDIAIQTVQKSQPALEYLNAILNNPENTEEIYLYSNQINESIAKMVNNMVLVLLCLFLVFNFVSVYRDKIVLERIKKEKFKWKIFFVAWLSKFFMTIVSIVLMFLILIPFVNNKYVLVIVFSILVSIIGLLHYHYDLEYFNNFKWKKTRAKKWHKIIFSRIKNIDWKKGFKIFFKNLKRYYMILFITIISFVIIFTFFILLFNLIKSMIVLFFIPLLCLVIYIVMKEVSLLLKVN